MKMVALQLLNQGWHEEMDYPPPAEKLQGKGQDIPPRKVFSKGIQRAYVGSMWTTFYELPHERTVENMKSIKTDDLASIRQFVLGG